MGDASSRFAARLSASPAVRPRVGIVLEHRLLPAWFREALAALRAGGEVEIALLIQPAEPMPPEMHAAGLGLFRRYMGFEARKNAVAPDATRCADVSPLLGAVATVRVRLDRRARRPELLAADATVIREYGLDVILSLGCDGLAPALCGLARLGVWSPAFGPVWSKSAELASFWAVAEGAPALAVRWVADRESTSGARLIAESHVSVDRYSVRRTANPAMWSAAVLLQSGLRRIGHSSPPLPPPEKPLPAPTNLRVFPFLSLHLSRRWQARQEARRFLDQWGLMFGFDAPRILDFADYHPLLPPADRFWADPFPVVREGRYCVFFEEALFAQSKGHIAVIELDEDGPVGVARTVIEQPYHMSYPFLLEWEGQLYMIPETAAANRIEVYRCIAFPDRWEKVGHLMENIRAYDATLTLYQGRWWMFVNVCEHDGVSSWEHLHLYYADHPLSTNWTAHPLNPVVSDVRRARPAGRLFKRGGALYRPSQNSAHYYGYGLKLNRIAVLSETDYREDEVESREPDWDPAIIGVHTLNRAGRLTVIDALWHRRRSRASSNDM